MMRLIFVKIHKRRITVHVQFLPKNVRHPNDSYGGRSKGMSLFFKEWSTSRKETHSIAVGTNKLVGAFHNTATAHRSDCLINNVYAKWFLEFWDTFLKLVPQLVSDIFPTKPEIRMSIFSILLNALI